MLLNIYLGTTAISWATVFIFSAAFEKKLEREGYKFVKEKKSISEKIASFISFAFKNSIPVYNIINTILVLCMSNKVYECMKDKSLEAGKIYMPTEETPISEDKISPREETKTYTESMEKASTEKKYDEMTLEEKLAYLERAREILTGQSRTIVDQPIEEASVDIFDQEQQGPVWKRTINRKQK